MVGLIISDEDYIKISDPVGTENRLKDHYSADMDVPLWFSTKTAVSFSPYLLSFSYNSNSSTRSPVGKYTNTGCEESNVEPNRVVPFKNSSLQQVQELTKDERVSNWMEELFLMADKEDGIKGFQYFRKLKVLWKSLFDKRDTTVLENCKRKKTRKMVSVAFRKDGLKGYQYLRKQKFQWRHLFDLNGIFQHVRLTTLCSTILQLLLFMVCFCGAYGKSTENPPCQLMFVGQLYSDKLLLKCFYNGHCKGTLKWTGGKSGTTLFNVETQRTEKVRFIDGKGEKWFGMQINNWNREDIEAHYKCWFGFSKLIVNIVNSAVLDQPFDVDVVECKRINGEKYLKLDAKVWHTKNQPSFTAFIQDKNITKHLTSIENPTKNGSWIETWIKLNLKLTEEDNNKTLMILIKEKIIIKKVINTKLCRGNEDSLKNPCDKVCEVLLLCLGGLGVLAAASFCIVYKKDLLCFKKETDNTEDEMANMNTNTDTTMMIQFPEEHRHLH